MHMEILILDENTDHKDEYVFLPHDLEYESTIIINKSDRCFAVCSRYNGGLIEDCIVDLYPEDKVVIVGPTAPRSWIDEKLHPEFFASSENSGWLGWLLTPRD